MIDLVTLAQWAVVIFGLAWLAILGIGLFVIAHTDDPPRVTMDEIDVDAETTEPDPFEPHRRN